MRNAKNPSRPGLSKLEKMLPAVLRNSGLERRLKEHAVFGLWSAVAGEKVAARSRPIFIDSQMNIVIAASDSAVAQEISLSRMQLLQSLIPLSRAAGVEIKGLRVDLKHYHQRPDPVPVEEVVSLPEPDEAVINSIELGAEQQLLLRKLEDELASRNDNDHRQHINKRILMVYQKQLRLDIWRKAHGFPICDQCGFAVSRVHAAQVNKVCFNCQMASES